MEADTIHQKVCSKCNTTKNVDEFIINKKVCRECRNAYTRERYKTLNPDIMKECEICHELKKCIKNRSLCIDCNNEKRRNKYINDNNHKERILKQSTIYKQNKAKIRAEKKEAQIKELENKIGSDNAICKYCEEVKPKTRFRHNRKKCADCERDDPMEKFKRIIRSRIITELKEQKTKHTIEYLGCNGKEYLKWLEFNDLNYTLDNRGTEWHIDHVIPLSHFDLNDTEQQMLAFNWRNTSALSPKENLTKNNKIIPEQISAHLEKLKIYHQENNIELPQKFIDLFATQPNCEKPLKTKLSNK